MRSYKNILVTGGAGFIGSNFIRYVLEDEKYSGNIINVDALTYAGSLENLKDIENNYCNQYTFYNVNICDEKQIQKVLEQHNIDCIVHFAAESHVDRSIDGPKDFIHTNVFGTFTLLEQVRKFWKNRKNVLFHHISTDEVYGSLGGSGYFYESTPYDPRSPYSSSKAASDHLVKAYFHTYNIPVTISNCSNNYGPYQFPEKLIPVMIQNILSRKSLPVYGDGSNVRDWLHVHDHNAAVWSIVKNGKYGETYNIGGENEWTNIDLVNFLCEQIAIIKHADVSEFKKLITFVEDRPGHDKRYAINCDKIKNDLRWEQCYTFEVGLSDTINWYLCNQEWVENVKAQKNNDETI